MSQNSEMLHPLEEVRLNAEAKSKLSTPMAEFIEPSEVASPSASPSAPPTDSLSAPLSE